MFQFLYARAENTPEEVTPEGVTPEKAEIFTPQSGFSPVFAILLFVLSVITVLGLLAYYFNYQASIYPPKKKKIGKKKQAKLNAKNKNSYRD